MKARIKHTGSLDQKNDMLNIDIGIRKVGKGFSSNKIKTTKYTWITFLPLNIYEQFKRAVYLYFLIVTVVSFFVNETISPLTSLLPLLFVIIVTALKDGLDDYSRFKSDKIVNTTKVTIIRNGKECSINSEFIAPGEIVVVTNVNDVPCDILLLPTSEGDNKCFITTANLDGETNLKTIHAPPSYPYSVESQTAVMGTIVCEAPTPDLGNFNGRIELQVDSRPMIIPLTIENILLRGVRLQGTDRILGCAIYTGMSTKLQLNSRYTGTKRASSEKYINKFIIALIVGMVIVVVIFYIIQRQREALTVPNMQYLGPVTNYEAFTQIFEDFLSFLILFNYMVPISMYMNIELYRIFGTIFLQSDLSLYDEESDQPCIVNASNLNEDLGQINILFSDKTGTITKNNMKFLKCSVSGREYHIKDTQITNYKTGESYNISMFDTDLVKFFEALCICHTVQEIPNNSISIYNAGNSKFPLKISDILSRYQASSSDEKAIVEGCVHLGMFFKSEVDNAFYVRRIIDLIGEFSIEEQYFKRLHVLQFSSERKRMSVIIRDKNGAIWIYSKGADNIILPLCKQNSLLAKVDADITRFAKEGLRTLTYARRRLTEDEYLNFIELQRVAQLDLEDRDKKMAYCYASVETDFDILGATALEDTLQENVDVTLSALQDAGIKIWILTGDKVETALSIGLACKHIPAEADVHYILGLNDVNDLLLRIEEIKVKLYSKELNALVIDGITVTTILRHASAEFVEIALNCKAVLCCRLTPLQKCNLITLIKKTKKYMTAAIGDGANDVSMIQEAHVGIGIMGKDGHQAARCADYAIAKFYMLQRLLLVHGHYNSERLSFLVLFYCYKNIVITGCMAIFQIYDLFSATSVYHSLYLWLFDIIYLSFSFTYLAISEKPYCEDTLLRYPLLYKRLSHNKRTSWWIFTKWILNGMLHTFIIYFFTYAVVNSNNAILNSGQTADFFCFGTMLIEMVIIVGNLKLILVSRFMTYINFVLIFASIVSFMLSTYIANIFSNSSLYWVFNLLVSSINIWLYIIICIVSCLLIDFFEKCIVDFTVVKPYSK